MLAPKCKLCGTTHWSTQACGAAVSRKPQGHPPRLVRRPQKKPAPKASRKAASAD
jgi:hypothetical protein